MNFMHFKMDLSDPSVRHALSDAQDFHRNIQRFFDASRAEQQVLFRVHGSDLYVTAKAEPLMKNANGISLINIREVPCYKKGDILRFNVLTQPYKKHGSKRIPLHDMKERLLWLNRQAAKCGFYLKDVREDGSESIESAIKSVARKGFSIKAFCYCGVLEVTDAELFNRAIASGVGASKAYGLGMLLVI